MTETIAGQAEPKRYQCRHIHADGRRCGSPCLRRQPLCYHHHTTRRPLADPRAHLADTNRRAAFDLPLPEDRAAIQISIGEVLRRIAANQLDPKRAGLLLYGLQIAALNLPPHPRPAAEQPAQSEQSIEDIVENETYGPLAPESELTQPQGRKTLEQILMERWEEEKEDWTRQMSAPTPHPDWTGEDESENKPIPKIQAAAEGCPMVALSGCRAEAEAVSWGWSLPKTKAPDITPARKPVSALYPAVTPGMPVTPTFLSDTAPLKTAATNRNAHPEGWAFQDYAGDHLISHTLTRAVPSAQRGLTSVFGMGTGVTLAVNSPANFRKIALAIVHN